MYQGMGKHYISAKHIRSKISINMILVTFIDNLFLNFSNLNGTYKVVVGEHNLHEGENNELVVNVERVIMHPDRKGDISLLT